MSEHANGNGPVIEIADRQAAWLRRPVVVASR